jgi:heptosyltransferase-1
VKEFRKQVQEREYDMVLDAQGLVKSAFLTYFTKGTRVGLDWSSARESLASLAYQRKCKVNFYQHAVVRMRQLFSQALAYELPTTAPDFGLNIQRFHSQEVEGEKYLVFLHGTTWTSKQWPEAYWIKLAELAQVSGYRVKLSGGSPQELARAHRIAAACSAVDVLPNVNIAGMASLLANAKAAVAVDTGFGHLAAAMGVPTVSIYGSTNADYTGALGKKSVLLSAQFGCSPCLSRVCTYRESSGVTPACYGTVPPERVWEMIA